MTEQASKAAPNSRRPSRLKWWLLLVALAAVAYYLYSGAKNPFAGTPSAGSAKKGGKGKGGQPPAIPVVGTRAQRGEIGVYFNGLGAVTPLNTVTIKSRVDGELMAVHFHEGDTVRKGDTLIEIDPRPFKVQLDQAEGQMAKDQANLENARVDLARYEKLLTQNAIQEQQVATQKSTVKQAEATVQSDQSQIDSAKLNLTYSRITSPITGQIGLRLVDPGNIVHAADPNGLVVITQMEPTSVLFTISQDQLPAVLQKMRAGQQLSVEAYDRDMKRKIATGTLTTVDNEIDQTTGTVRLRANFENTDHALFPSQFVNARLLVERKRGIVLLPNAAIQRTSSTAFVYLVKPDSTVTVRNITTGTSEGENTEITSGLAPGDVVVMTGVDKLEEGSKVQVQLPGEAGTAGRGKGKRQ
jgi:membrane fusion protein, multidrug efflux system